MDLELIEDYILNRLSAEEERTVQERIKNESEFAKAYAQQKLLSETVVRFNSRENIKAIHEQKMQEWGSHAGGRVIAFRPKRQTFKVLYRFAGAAVAACLVAVLYLGNADFYLPDVTALIERGNTDANNSGNQVYQDYILAQGMLAEGKYTEAAETFEVLKNNEGLRAYYQDAARWFEVVAVSGIDEKKASLLLDDLESQEDFKYPLSLMERLKMKVRLWF